MRKKPFIEFESGELITLWKETLLSDENDVLEALCVFTLEKKFWDELHELHKNNTEDDMKNRLIKLNIYLEKRFKKIGNKKIKKLHERSSVIKDDVNTRFEEYLDIFTF